MTDGTVQRFSRRGEKRWLVAEYALEGGEIRRGLTERVLCKLGPGDESVPGVLVAVAEGSAQSPGSFFLFDRCSVGGIQKIGLLSHLGARRKTSKPVR